MRAIFTCTDDEHFASRVIFAARFFVYFLLGLGFIAFDFFGLSTRTEELTQDVYNLVASPFYEGGHEAPTDQRVAVVLVDDAAMAENGWTWPLDYMVHARILGEVMRACPNQLFIDFRYVRTAAAEERRDFSEYLSAVREELAAPGPDGQAICPSMARDKDEQKRIFYAIHDAGDIEDAPRFLADFGEPVRVSWIQRPGVYPMRVQPESAESAAGPRSSTDRSQPPTPALALYQNMPGAPAAAASFHHRMALRWGASLPPGQERFSTFETDPAASDKTRGWCRAVPSDPWGRAWTAVKFLAQGAASAIVVRDPEPIQPCPFILSLRGDALIYGAYGAEALDFGLRGRQVLYGFDVRASPDLVQTVLHGRLSGVYIHAQALDNLVAYGADYFRRDSDLRTLMEMLVWAALVGVFCVRQHRRDRAEQTRRALRRDAPPTGPHGVAVACLVQDECSRLLEMLRTLAVLTLAIVLLIMLCLWLRIAMADIVGLAAMRGLVAVVQQFGLVSALVLCVMRLRRRR